MNEYALYRILSIVIIKKCLYIQVNAFKNIVYNKL